MKEKWKLETFFNFGLAIKVPSWKYYPISIYLREHIIFLGMCVDDVEPLHIVMYDNKEKVMQVWQMEKGDTSN